MENENRESEVSLIKEVASLTEAMKFVREDIRDMKADIRKLCDAIPVSCNDCNVKRALDAHMQEHKDKDNAAKDNKRFRWDIFSIVSACVLTVGMFAYTVIHDNQMIDKQKQTIEIIQQKATR